MTVLSPASWTQYSSYDARNDRLHVSAMLNASGATSTTAFAVTQQVVPSMVLTVGAGSAFIESNWANVQGHYAFVNDAPVNVTVQPADPTFPRIDRVIARVYDAFYEGTENKAQIEIKKGDPAVSPSVPDLPWGSIELARISVAAGATTIVTANINNSVMPLASLRESLVSQSLASAWTAYTPTFNNITVGNGTVVGRYKIVGKTVNVMGSLTFGSTTSIPVANPSLVLPVTASSAFVNIQTIGSLALLDSGTTYQVGWARLSTTSTALILPTSGTGISSTVPWTWTTSDAITWNLTYEIA